MTPLDKINCFLLDMDGTVYLGDELIDGAGLFLDTIRTRGKRYIFVTNNSSKNGDAYAKKLNRLGVRADPGGIFTSGEAAAIYLNQIMPGADIFLLGTDALEDEFTRAGFKIEKGVRVPGCVVLGFDTGLTYAKLWAACDHIRAGVPYYATHPDLNCPIEGGRLMPDTGSMIAFIKAATGKKPEVIGKPNGRIVDALLAKYGLRKEEIAIVGDRLYTDIKTGADFGITSALVLSGETDLRMSRRSRIKSDYVFNSVKDIIPYL